MKQPVQRLCPVVFEQKFQEATGLNLLRASHSLPRSLPGNWQPLTDYRNLLLSLIAKYLLICNIDIKGCSYQFDGILSLLPEDQQVSNQDLQTGSIEPFLHVLIALLRWMNPQPAIHKQSDVVLQEGALTGITVVFPIINSPSSSDEGENASENNENDGDDDEERGTFLSSGKMKKRAYVYELEDQNDSINKFVPPSWKLPVPDALSIGSVLVPMLLFSKHSH